MDQHELCERPCAVEIALFFGPGSIGRLRLGKLVCHKGKLLPALPWARKR
jgi:hypothetical protein